MATKIKYTSDSKQNKKAVANYKMLVARENARKTSRSIGRWNAKTVRNAIQLQADGDFSETARLSRLMLADSAFSAALEKRLLSIVQSELTFEIPSEEVNPKSDYTKKITENVWFDCVDEIVIKQLLKNYLLFGASVAFTEWDEYTRLPTITIWNMEDVRFDISTSKWYTQTEIGEEQICPGDGNWILLSDWKPGEITGFVSHLGLDYLSKAYAIKDWTEGNRNHIDTIAVLKNVDGNKLEQHELNSLVNEYQGQKLDRFFYIDSGYEMKFQDAMQGYKPEAFENLIKYVDRKYQIEILGSNIGSEMTDKGARAAVETYRGVEKDLVKSDSQIISSALREQFNKFIIKLHLGDWFIEETPWPRWLLEIPEDIEIKLKNIGAFQKIISNTGLEITNLNEIAEQLGLKLKRKRTIENNDNNSEKENDSANQKEDESSNEEE